MVEPKKITNALARISSLAKADWQKPPARKLPAASILPAPRRARPKLDDSDIFKSLDAATWRNPVGKLGSRSSMTPRLPEGKSLMVAPPGDRPKPKLPAPAPAGPSPILFQKGAPPPPLPAPTQKTPPPVPFQAAPPVPLPGVPERQSPVFPAASSAPITPRTQLPGQPEPPAAQATLPHLLPWAEGVGPPALPRQSPPPQIPAPTPAARRMPALGPSVTTLASSINLAPDPLARSIDLKPLIPGRAGSSAAEPLSGKAGAGRGTGNQQVVDLLQQLVRMATELLRGNRGGPRQFQGPTTIEPRQANLG
jgi:hypothetical protein